MKSEPRVVTEAIDFSHFFEVAEQYRERERYLDAAAVYRALFERIDDNEVRVDAFVRPLRRSLAVCPRRIRRLRARGRS
nr:hypothetical protein [Halobellus sp. DFY28]